MIYAAGFYAIIHVHLGINYSITDDILLFFRGLDTSVLAGNYSIVYVDKLKLYYTQPAANLEATYVLHISYERQLREAILCNIDSGNPQSQNHD